MSEKNADQAVKVEVGQVWADNDPRIPGRTVEVVRLFTVPMVRRKTGPLPVDQPYAECRVLTGAPRMIGKRVDIRVDRFRPTSTGYRLVSPASAATIPTPE